jgi:tRNA-binding protein
MVISIDDFEKVDIRIGKIIDVKDFRNAKKPAYQLTIDFGSEIGIKHSSAQITALYTKDELVGKQILAVVNFPPRQIANFFSEVLVLGLKQADESVVLIEPEREVSLGSKLS